MNLVVNARDATPNGGKLTIETSNVELSEDYAEQHVDVKAVHHVLLAVSDTGLGFDPATRQRLFEPFYTTKEVGKGAGLGLATVHGIVKQSGGRILAYSEPGQGSTFKIYLPRSGDPVEAAPRQTALERSVAGTETVLLVEDEKVVRGVTERILRHSGYQVLTAADGAEALQLATEFSGVIHLLLTDVVVPRMSGRELAQRLVQLRPQVRVLYMSGYTDNAIVHHGVLDPGTQFIGKPFSASVLMRKVRDVLG